MVSVPWIYNIGNGYPDPASIAGVEDKSGLSPARLGIRKPVMHRLYAIASKIKRTARFLAPNLGTRAKSDTSFLFIFK
jgi:hypothetical protein